MKGKISIALFILALVGFFVWEARTQETEKLTEEEARELIEGYHQKEQSALAKMDEEQAKIEELRNKIRDLEMKIAQCKEELSKRSALEGEGLSNPPVYGMAGVPWKANP